MKQPLAIRVVGSSYALTGVSSDKSRPRKRRRNWHRGNRRRASA